MGAVLRLGLYKHHTGTSYVVLGFCKTNSETFVIYKNMKDHTFWSRPLADFVMYKTGVFYDEFFSGDIKSIKTNVFATKDSFPTRDFSYSFKRKEFTLI